MEMMKYKLAVQLFKIYNGAMINDDWLDLNDQQNFNERFNSVQIFDTSRIRVGKNIIMNRMTCLNRRINYDWLNLSLIGYKLKVKELFLTQS